MPIEEDEHGSYILNSKDLRAIEYVAKLAEIGVDSLKIEGRTKSPYYVARTCQSYRQRHRRCRGRESPSMRNWSANSTASPTAATPPASIDRHPDRDYQNYLSRQFRIQPQSLRRRRASATTPRASPRSPSRTISASATASRSSAPPAIWNSIIDAMKNRDGEAVSVAPGSGHLMRIALPAGCEGAFVARYV
jgi:putative protease